jgi:hypothetical protein
MLNIDLITGQSSPFNVECGCIDSRWPKHAYWIPENSRVSILALQNKETSTVSLDDLTRMRRGVIRILDQLETHHIQPSGLGSRIRQLSISGVIPREIFPLMLVITEMRNAAEYESKLLTSSESEAVKFAWEAISNWAISRGLRVVE